MNKKVSIVMFLFIILLHSTAICADGFKYIEIFDPKQDKVVKIIQPNKKINNMVIGWINGIDGIYGKNDPIKDNGYVIRFPLDPAIQVK